MKYLILILILITLNTNIQSQIKGVMHQLHYNESTGIYTMMLHVSEGQTTNLKQRVQCSSQIGIVAPANSQIEILETFNPSVHKDRKTIWSVTSTIHSPTVDSNHSFFGISPNLSPTSFYPELKQGDALPLFSFKVIPQPIDFYAVRFYDNKIDPDKDKKGMSGGDFNNGFTIGGVEQLYSGSLPHAVSSTSIAEKN